MSTDDFRVKNPGATGMEIKGLKYAHWKTLTDEQKEGWGKMQNQSNPLNQAKEPLKSAFGKVEKSKKILMKKTGYDIFASQTIEKVLKEQPDLENEEAMNVVKETWELVSAEVQNKYDQLAS